MIESVRDGDVVTLTIRRPERRNALDTAHCRELSAAVTDAVGSGARAAVVTGEGTSFCAGADLDGVYGEEFLEALYGMLRVVAEAPLPVVAAVNGPAIGAGTQLALACDVRVGAPEAVFGVPTVRNGLAVDTWTIDTLRDVAGGAAARSLLIAAEMPRLERALAYGLVDRAGDLDDAVAWAREMAAYAPLTVAYTKLVLNADRSHPGTAQRIETAWRTVWASDDVRESAQARREKRAPVFRGR